MNGRIAKTIRKAAREAVKSDTTYYRRVYQAMKKDYRQLTLIQKQALREQHG